MSTLSSQPREAAPTERKPRSKAASGTTLPVRLTNPGRLLWPNQFVKARLLLKTEHNALVVPAVAVQRGPKGTFVYVAAEDGTAANRPVDVELLIGDQAVLSKGVRPGEQVVVEGQNQLRPGAKVSARPAAGGSADRSDGERDKTGRGGGHKP